MNETHSGACQLWEFYKAKGASAGFCGLRSRHRCGTPPVRCVHRVSGAAPHGSASLS
jgi:hypothetical protein